MNWSTRLRRWVRIRMPPVREASTKPTAATVLPAPVACSNQKRRLAPGSSGASSTTSSSSASGSSQSWGSPRRGRAPRRLVELGHRAVAVRRPRPVPRRCRARRCAPFARAVGAELLELGDDRRQRPGERVDLVLVELGAVERASASRRRAAARARAAASSRRATRSDGASAPSSSSPRAASTARRRAVPGASASSVSPVEQDRLARELAHPLEVGARSARQPLARLRRSYQP